MDKFSEANKNLRDRMTEEVNRNFAETARQLTELNAARDSAKQEEPAKPKNPAKEHKKRSSKATTQKPNAQNEHQI